MKLKFDSTQQYQLDAINSLVNLFEGQPLSNGDYAIQINTSANKGQASIFQTELGIGNNLVLSEQVFYNNLLAVQDDADIEPITESEFRKTV